MSSSYQLQQLTGKLKDGDPDLRCMALTDIQRSCSSGSSWSVDDSTEAALVDGVLSLFNDSIAEVKSGAARTVSVLVPRVREERVQTIIERLTQMTSDKDDSLRDVASLGLKTVVNEIRPDSKLANTACTKLAPKLLAQLKNTSSSQDLLIQLVEVLTDVYSRFDATIRSMPNTQSEGLAGLTPLLNDQRGAIRKRAIRALGSLAACSGESLYTSLFDKELLPALTSARDVEQSKTAIALAGTLALSAPGRTGKRVAQIVPPVIKATDNADEELKEVALQTLETLMLRCPTETTPYISQIVDVAAKLIKYDPNYAAGDEDMDGDAEMNGADSEAGSDAEDEDEYEEEYDDDDDVSWKVRRASVKILSAAIETRLEMLASFYKSIAPVLVSRFGEREETVRLEVWTTYTALLKQTGLSAGVTALPATSPSLQDDGSVANSRAQSPATSLKRKRDEEMDTNDSPIAALRSQAPQVAKTIIKQLSSTKSVAVRLAGFHLLYQLIFVLQGGLEAQAGPLFSVIEAVLKSSDSGASHGSSSASTTSLKMQVYAFLSLLFRTHSLRCVQPHLPKLTPLLVKSISDKNTPKIGAAAFSAASEMVKLVRPASGIPSSPLPNGDASSAQQQLRAIFDVATTCLSRSDIDQDIRERGLVCLGDLFIHAGGDLRADVSKALAILKDRLRNENTRLVALMTLARVAESPAAKSNAAHYGTFLQDCAEEVVEFLRKTNKPVQAASFVCLDAILRTSGAEISKNTAQSIVKNLQPAVAQPDIHLARSLNALATLLETKPAETVKPIEQDILPSVYELIGTQTQVLTGPAMLSLLRLFREYTAAGGNGPTAVTQLREIATGAKAGVQTEMVASKCIGAIYRVVLEKDGKAAEKIIKDVTSKLKTTGKTDPRVLCLGYLTIGEIGRKTDLSAHSDIFKSALSNLSHANEDVRSASAFALGNMAAGSPSTYLPSVLEEIQKAGQDDRKMHLLLSSVKEILSHSSAGALSELSEALWEPLFAICDRAQAQESKSKKDNSAKAGDEARLDGTRNIASECLGKITLTDPAEYLGKLQARLDSESAGTRGAVITAIRYTFSDASSSYDDLLAPLIVPFLSLMSDKDLTVRRLAISALTSAAHNKPALIRDHMSALQPILYQETKIDPSLIHEVVMGPFKVKVDDGLNIRKAAFQCMYTLMETCLSKIDLTAFLDIIVSGLSDDDDIKVSCYLMLVKLGSIAPTAVVQRLDAAAAPFDATLKMKLKDTAVKQEVEKLAGVQRSALRTMAALLPLSSESSTPKFTQLANETRDGALWGRDFKEMITNAQENKAGAGGADRMDID